MQDLNLVDYSYDRNYKLLVDESQTKDYICNEVFSKDNIHDFILDADILLLNTAKRAKDYLDWIKIAKENAKIEYYAAIIGYQRKTEELNGSFKQFLLSQYKTISGSVNKYAPSILTKTIDFIAHDRVVLIVMDGMSLFDFEVISRHLNNFDYSFNCSYALIPTVTSISRQSLLSGKYPRDLDNPFTLTNEEKEFYAAAERIGYDKGHTYFGRGYEANLSLLTRFATIILNDIDDMVHGQTMGRQGMYQNVDIFAKSGKLQHLIDRIVKDGYTVYLTSDHGNTNCHGTGASGRSGVETATKSKRMLVLKDFAEVSGAVAERTFEYPGYYLDTHYKYYICNDNTSFDKDGENVMTHGGITLDEVIVPFIKIKGEKSNG